MTIQTLADSAGSIGTNGQVLKSNGTNIVWGSDNNSVTGVKGNAESSYRTGNVNITAANIGLGNVENTKLSTWAGSTNITTLGTITTGTVPWARLSNVPSASTTAPGIIKIGTAAGTAAEGNHTHPLSLASDTGTSTVTLTAGNKFKLTAGGNEVIFTMPSAYSLPIATNDTLGGVKPWYSHTKASTGPTTGSNATAVAVNAITTTSGKYYAIESDSNGRLFVNVPWSNTWTKLSTSAAGYVGTKLPGNTTTFLRGDGTWNAPAYPVTSVATKTGAVTLGTLTIGNKTYNGSGNTTIEIADLGLASTTTFLGITSTNLSNGSTTSPVTIVIGPTTGNVSPSNGSVVMEQSSGEEYIWTGNKWNLMGLASSWALANHIHGNILNNGTIASDTTVGSGQHLVITDSNNKVSRSSLSLDTTKTTEYLTHAGTWATPPDNNTTYTFANGTNGFTVTPLGGTAQTVTVTPSIVNNITGSGTSGYLAKFNGTNTLTNGPQLGSSTTTFLNNSGAWSAPTGDHKVTQAAAITTNAAYPVILANSTATTAVTNTVNKASTLTYNPSTTKLHTPIVEVTSASFGGTLPSTGTTGQIFFQTGAEYYELPTGGTTGQVLAKSSNANRAVQWVNPPSVSPSSAKFYPAGSTTTTTNSNAQVFNTAIYVQNNVLFGAAWNDYAEYREVLNNINIQPGKCVVENGDDTIRVSINRMEPGASIVSDTYGFAIGKTETANLPIAVSGRVLAYPYENREEFKKNIGKPVCSGPNGTVSIMTDEEYRNYGYCAIGTISSVPNYEIWGENNIKVDNRVWIKVR